jgi:hypothetical protein
MPFFCSYGKRTGVIDGFGGIGFPYIKKFDSLSFKDYLISAMMVLNNLGVGPRNIWRKHNGKMRKRNRHNDAPAIYPISLALHEMKNNNVYVHVRHLSF